MTPEVVDRVRRLESLCTARSWTVGVAESCTGGLLSAWITSQPGVSAFFAGGVVSYAREVKCQVLEVPQHLIQAFGEVSVPVARAMARGARRALGCDWSVSLTGVAGPSGGSPEKPVGFVCFAVTGPGFESGTFQHFEAASPAVGAGLSGREDIQRQAALFAFDLLLNAMR